MFQRARNSYQNFFVGPEPKIHGIIQQQKNSIDFNLCGNFLKNQKFREEIMLYWAKP